MSYCAETDPLAHRLVFILAAFRDVIDQQKGYSAFQRIANMSDDPILDFFNGSPVETAASDNSTSPNKIVMGSMQHAAAKLPRPSANTLSPQDSVHRHSSGQCIESEGEIEFEAFWSSNPSSNHTT
jgi:hypothetical protein